MTAPPPYRPSASSITDDQLDALYAELDRLRGRSVRARVACWWSAVWPWLVVAVVIGAVITAAGLTN